MEKDSNSALVPSTNVFQEHTKDGFCSCCGCPVFMMPGGLIFHDESKITLELLENCEIYNPLWYRALCELFTPPDGIQ